jgi:hypothetical protein
MTTPARQRQLRTAKQQAYRARLKDGFKSHKLDADPLDVAELLKVAHIAIPPNPDQKALNRGLTDLVQLWNEGKVGVVRVPVVGEEE